MILCVLNYSDTGKSTATREVIKQCLNNENYDFKQGKSLDKDSKYGQDYTDRESIIQDINGDLRGNDYYALFQHKQTQKFLCILTQGDDPTCIENAFKWIFILISIFSIHSSSLNIICTAKQRYRNINNTNEIKQQIDEKKLSDHELLWVKQPCICTEKGRTTKKTMTTNKEQYIDITSKAYAKSLIDFIEKS